jgi:methionyl-tRNA formyltransferase
MKIIYLGSGEFGIECLKALADSGHTLPLIVTQPAQLAGRGRKPRPTPVAEWAKDHSVEFVETDNVNTPEMVGRIGGLRPDLILVIAFGQKIGDEVINLPPKGAINVHASLLPKYRGAAPINWAVINGEPETGISIITLAEKMDAGRVVAQQKTELIENDTAGELHDRLAGIAAPLLLKTLEQIAAGTAAYAEQDHSQATLAPKLKKSDGFLDFEDSADVLRRKILGFWPWPGASAIYTSKETAKSVRVTIATANVVETSDTAALPTGTLNEQLNVICGENALRIEKIKPDGSRLMDFADFVNGQHTKTGDTFTKIKK